MHCTLTSWCHLGEKCQKAMNKNKRESIIINEQDLRYALQSRIQNIIDENQFHQKNSLLSELEIERNEKKQSRIIETRGKKINKILKENQGQSLQEIFAEIRKKDTLSSSLLAILLKDTQCSLLFKFFPTYAQNRISKRMIKNWFKRHHIIVSKIEISVIIAVATLEYCKASTQLTNINDILFKVMKNSSNRFNKCNFKKEDIITLSGLNPNIEVSVKPIVSTQKSKTKKKKSTRGVGSAENNKVLKENMKTLDITKSLTRKKKHISEEKFFEDTIKNKMKPMKKRDKTLNLIARLGKKNTNYKIEYANRSSSWEPRQSDTEIREIVKFSLRGSTENEKKRSETKARDLADRRLKMVQKNKNWLYNKTDKGDSRAIITRRCRICETLTGHLHTLRDRNLAKHINSHMKHFRYTELINEKEAFFPLYKTTTSK